MASTDRFVSFACSRVFEGCLLINKLLLNNYSLIEKHIDIQIDTLFGNALRYHAGCPFLPGRINFTDRPIMLPADLVKFNALSKVRFKTPKVFLTER